VEEAHRAIRERTAEGKLVVEMGLVSGRLRRAWRTRFDMKAVVLEGHGHRKASPIWTGM
jgi:hypothetical protein